MHSPARPVAIQTVPPPVATPEPESTAVKEENSTEGFLEHVKNKAKPGLAALVGNAYRVRKNGSALVIFLDKSHANLIPMLKMPQNFKLLDELAADYFGGILNINFSIGHDPKLLKQIKREEEALEIVKSNPTVKFVLEQFNGTIVNCQILNQPKE